METAKAFHYTWSAWLAESPIVRAKLVAHELVKGMRETYNFEQRLDSEKSDTPKQPAPWDLIRQRFFK